MSIGDVLVDPRFWIFLFVFGTPMIAIEIIVFRGYEQFVGWVRRKLGPPR